MSVWTLAEDSLSLEDLTLSRYLVTRLSAL